ncbi:polysaccharide pyruvyl transferase family protein [Arenibaculum sp.]|jgi:polysaccharide pyruvyl transferase CsaB|uniref:polysaccharide pyruvyl transferase family protein n=1 Tax=Arenibaculum sp. TaxID=2865862 RepID=UPI002E0FCD9F|nr:polysaccharide pyruvyl transferase family protein [Arenibaculum sp.]
MTTVGISGSYGGLNLGDEAILASATAQLRMAIPGVEVIAFSRNAEHTRRNHDVDRAINARTALRDQILPEVKRLDLLLLGGGGILYDTEAKTYLREVVMAQELGVPTFAFAIGIGPLKDKEERDAVRDGLNRMAGITVREITAKRLCEEIGVTMPVKVTADPALLLDPEPFTDDMLNREGIPDDARLIGMSVREAGAAAPGLEGAAYHDLIATTADYMVRRYDARVVFVPMERADLREIHRVLSRMGDPKHAHILKAEYRPRQILGLMGRFEMAVGMRLHFLVFAALSGVPMMALPYAPKVMDFLTSLDVEQRTAVEEAHAGAFLADLDRLWDNRDAQLAAVADRLPRLRALASRTVPLAAGVIGLGQGTDDVQDRTGEDLAGTPIAY